MLQYLSLDLSYGVIQKGERGEGVGLGEDGFSVKLYSISIDCILISSIDDYLELLIIICWFICSYNPNKFVDDDDDDNMEAGFDEILREEKRRFVSQIKIKCHLLVK